MTPDMNHVRVFAPAKINLFLHVTGKRADGYHLLESLVAFADIGDHISVSPALAFSLKIDGPFAKDLQTESDNAVLKAARFFQNFCGTSSAASITLTKNLPIASGIGGGSSDAAATILALQTLWRSTHTPDSVSLAAQLGADVPVCLQGTPTIMRGIGEELQPIPKFPACHVVLINPGQGLSTADVFRARAGLYSAPVNVGDGWDDALHLTQFLQTTRNDLMAPALKIMPEIDTVLSALTATNGCLLARMSGSGATCFGLFNNPDQARHAADTIAAAHPSWWTRHGTLTSIRATPELTS